MIYKHKSHTRSDIKENRNVSIDFVRADKKAPKKEKKIQYLFFSNPAQFYPCLHGLSFVLQITIFSKAATKEKCHNCDSKQFENISSC